MIRALDAATVLTPHAARIAAAGFKHVGRYLKSLSAPEIAALHAAGLGIWLIYETSADRALGGAGAGAADGARAARQAGALNAPRGTALFAAVDFDPQSADLHEVLAYLTAFHGATGDYYPSGTYAAGAVLTGSPGASWLAGASGWSGSRAYAASGAATLTQGPQVNAGSAATWQGINWPALPFAYDANILAREDFGLWLPPTEPEPQQSGAIPPVRALQEALVTAGFSPGAIDGAYGPRTEAALRAYYQAHP